jgi:predicted nucleotidyltransferase
VKHITTITDNDYVTFGLAARDIKTIAAIFARFPEVSLLYIFGSRAKGNYRPGSDIDLAIMNKGVSPLTVLRIKGELDDSSLPYKITLVNASEIEGSELGDQIKKTGRPFYTRG